MMREWTSWAIKIVRRSFTFMNRIFERALIWRVLINMNQSHVDLVKPSGKGKKPEKDPSVLIGHNS
jgi:hypothetical protein